MLELMEPNSMEALEYQYVNHDKLFVKGPPNPQSLSEEEYTERFYPKLTRQVRPRSARCFVDA